MQKRNIILGLAVILAIGVTIALLPSGKQADESAVLQSPHFATGDLLNQPIPLRRSETTAGAMAVWSKYRNLKPTLLLLSNNPHLTRPPQAIEADIARLLASGIPEQILQATDSGQPDPLLRSESAVDLALRNGWFKRLAWALPLPDPAMTVKLDTFANQLKSQKLIDETEAASLELTDRLFSGELRGQQMYAAALPLLQNIDGPVVVHIDLSYFQPLYKNEITTPLLQVVHETLTTLKKMHLKTLAVTFSYGHLDEQVALDVRFIGNIVAYLIEDPTRLDQEIPQNWQRQSEAMALEHFNQTDQSRILYLEQENEAPQAAWVKYNLYRAAARDQAVSVALDYLDKAVAIDPVYALDFLRLASDAYNKGQAEQAIELLKRAEAALPDNSEVGLILTRFIAMNGDSKEARQRIDRLQQLPWSRVYYPEIPKNLAELAANLPPATDLKDQSAE